MWFKKNHNWRIEMTWKPVMICFKIWWQWISLTSGNLQQLTQSRETGVTGGSVQTGTCQQAWWPQLHPWEPRGGRENCVPQAALWHSHACCSMYTSSHSQRCNKNLKTKATITGTMRLLEENIDKMFESQIWHF